MLSSISEKLKVLRSSSNLLMIVVTILSVTPILGLGFKNTILSGAVTLVFLLILNPKFDYTKTKGAYLLMAFLFFFSLSQFFRQTPYGFHEYLNLGLGAYAAFVFLQEKFKLKQFSKFLITLTSLYSVFSVFYLIFSPNDRAFGLFFGAEPYTTYPNAFADLLIVSIVLYASSLVSDSLTNSLKKYDLALLFTSLTAFWLTFSRGAYLSLFMGLSTFLICYLFQNRQSFKLIIQKALILLLVAVMSLLTSIGVSSVAEYSSELSERIQSSDPASVRSANERPVLWQGAIQIAQKYPVFGSGSGSFQFVYPEVQDELLSNAPHPHNLILKLLSENGIFTALTFLTMLAYSFRPASFRKNLPIVATFLALNIHFCLDYNLNFPILAFLYFFLLSQLLGSQPKISPNRSNLLKYSGFLLAAIFSLLIFTQTYGYYHIKQLENNPNLPFYHISLAQIAPFEHQLYSLTSYPIMTNKYPVFHPYLYVQTITETNPETRYQQAKKLLELNYYNDLEYHYTYLEAALSLNKESSIQDFESQAFTLVRDYISLLQINTHNTVTSKNPKNALNIIQFYQRKGNLDWDQLEKTLLSVYKSESNKFQTRFNYNLPSLNE